MAMKPAFYELASPTRLHSRESYRAFLSKLSDSQQRTGQDSGTRRRADVPVAERRTSDSFRISRSDRRVKLQPHGRSGCISGALASAVGQVAVRCHRPGCRLDCQSGKRHLLSSLSDHCETRSARFGGIVHAARFLYFRTEFCRSEAFAAPDRRRSRRSGVPRRAQRGAEA